MARKSVGHCAESFASVRTKRGAVIFLLVVASLSGRPLNAQEGFLTLALESDPGRRLAIGSVQRNGIAYASLHDIARALALSATESPQTRALAVKVQTATVTFFPDNPFVTIVRQPGQRTTLQMPAATLATAGALYVPITAFAPSFEQFFGVKATFHQSTGTLLIGKLLPPRPAYDIAGIVIEPKANGVALRISATKPLALYEGLLKDDGWFYLTIPNAKADIAALNKTRPSGGVSQIVATQFTSSVQIVFRLDRKYTSSEVVTDPASNDLLISIRSTTDDAIAAIEGKRKAVVTNGLDRHRKRHELDVIVLDPGHGGRDPGAIGVTGTKEKDVALGIALKLGRLIRMNMKGVKVVYTRDDDTFVELDRRGQIANEAGGKLFISIHCNSMPRKPSPYRGFEVYLLRPGRTDEAIAIAERENSVIKLEEGYEQRYKHLTDENFILVTMAQSAHLRASEMFAEIATKEMSRRLDTPNNGVKQAGFYVLVGSAMPNVLVETAYLSNREDERMLRSESGQERIADALFNAIKRYKAEYEKLLQEGKDIGEK